MTKFDKKTYFRTVATFAVCVLLALCYFGFKTFDNYKMQREEKARQLELQIESQRVEENQKKLVQEEKEKLRDQEIADLRQELADLKGRPPEVKTITNTVTVPEKDTIAEIVKEWSPRVAYIECSWFSSTGALSAKSSGSVTLIKYTGLGIQAVTSKHILAGANNYAPKSCRIELQSGPAYTILIKEENVNIGKNEDWAYISLPSDETLTTITKQNVKLCAQAQVGDKLLIMGYPKIGSKGLTVTDGILSGVDKNYYVTSAKIDKGNSGGAAILVKDDCYLGIPSASVVGAIESLGRILKASFVIN